MVRVLLLDLLDDSFDLLCFAIVDSQVVLIVLDSCAHAVKSLSNFALLVSDERLSEETFCAGVVVPAKLLAEPIQNNCKVFLGLVVQNYRDLNLVVLCDGEIVLNDELLPDLDYLLEKGLRVD